MHHVSSVAVYLFVCLNITATLQMTPGLTNQPTSIKQSPTWEANSHSASQEIHFL
jgi:hypothetical protein